MPSIQSSVSRKRAVNLTLSEPLVARAREVTDNLSGVVETLLADYVQKAEAERQARRQVLDASVSAWNAFDERVGAFADEHSTL